MSNLPQIYVYHQKPTSRGRTHSQGKSRERRSVRHFGSEEYEVEGDEREG